MTTTRNLFWIALRNIHRRRLFTSLEVFISLLVTGGIFSSFLVKTHLNETFGSIYSKPLLLIYTLLALVLVLGVLLSFAVIFILIKERENEVGILRAVGAQRRDIIMLVLIEILLVVISGGVLGVAIILFLFSSYIGYFREIIEFVPGFIGYMKLIGFGILSILFMSLISVIAATYPVLYISQVDPYRVIRSAG